MSEFGKREFERFGIKTELISHGVDTTIFKPENKSEAKEWLEKHSVPLNREKPAKIDENSFVVGINAANKDPFRKDFGRMFTAFQIFLDQNPDAKKDAQIHFMLGFIFPAASTLFI